MKWELEYITWEYLTLRVSETRHYVPPGSNNIGFLMGVYYGFTFGKLLGI